MATETDALLIDAEAVIPRGKLTLRDYQQEAADNFQKWLDGPEMEALIALTMGMGKTVTAAECISIFLERHPDGKVLWLTHREELLDHSSMELAVHTGRACEIEKAEQRCTGQAPIVVASIQSLRLKRLQRLAEVFTPGLIVCDEAHHALALSWMQVKQAFPQAKILNLTATPFRADVGNRLELGTVLVERNTTDSIKTGFLVPPRPVGKLEIDLGGVKKSLGDYETGSLSALLCQPDILQACVTLVEANAKGRKSILFAASVEHGQLISQALRAIGFRVGEIYGTTPTEERRGYYAAIYRGNLDILVNNLVLTEGFNMPCLDMVIMLPRTKNAGLYLQCVGRGLRADPENPAKQYCTVIDVVDTSKRKGGKSKVLPNQDDVRTFGALRGRPASEPEVFLSWFYRASEIMEVLTNKRRITDCARLTTSTDLHGLAMPPWLAALVPSASFDPIWTPSGRYSNLFKSFRTGDADAFCLFVGRKGWMYLPHNQLPENIDRLEEEISEEEEEAGPNYTLETLVSNDAQLKNFILNLFDKNQSLKDQAAKYYAPFEVKGQMVVWFKVMKQMAADFQFIQWKSDDFQYNFFLVRHASGKIYAFRQAGYGSLMPLPGRRVGMNLLPHFVLGTSWAKKPMSDKQAKWVAKILGMSIEDATNAKISKLSASALMSNDWNRRQLETISGLLTEGTLVEAVFVTHSPPMSAVTDDGWMDTPSSEMVPGVGRVALVLEPDVVDKTLTEWSQL